MRILIPTVDYPPIEGGISTVTLQVSRELARQGHVVTVLAPHFPDMENFDNDEVITVVRYPGYDLGWGRLIPFLRMGRPLLKECDLIIGINVAYAGVLARFSNVPYVMLAYGYEFLKFQHTPIVSGLFRSIYAHAAGCIAISNYTRSALQHFGVNPASITVAHPGTAPAQDVDPRHIQGLRNEFDIGDGPIILAVGRFIPRKGHEVLIQAMPHILENVPTAQLVLVGRGPTRDDCIARIKSANIEANVHCPGYLDDVALAALYAHCSVFALPTSEEEGGQVEGFGLVFTEAHAYAKPVVAGRSGGVSDAVLHEETGLLVNGENAVAVGDAILRILQNPAFARELGEAGRKRVEEELNWERFTAAILGCVDE